MRKLFIHNPLFRLLSPVFSGMISYLLILLVSNNVGQLQEQFFGQELYICIGLSYAIQEFSRLLLFVFQKIESFTSELLMLLFQVVTSLLLTFVIVTVFIYYYYQYALGFMPSFDDYLIFNSIFCSITLIYILLYISHEYLFKVNNKKLENELLIKQNIEEDFKQFKREINPSLLFQSFEHLLVLIKEDKEDVDEFIDHLATIYRYILASKKDQLVSLNKEVCVLKEFVKLHNHLPYRNVSLVIAIQSDFLIVPGTLIFLLEQVVKTTITSKKTILEIILNENEANLVVNYQPEDKIIEQFSMNSILEIERVYSVYSSQKIKIEMNKEEREILIPKLEIKL